MCYHIHHPSPLFVLGPLPLPLPLLSSPRPRSRHPSGRATVSAPGRRGILCGRQPYNPPILSPEPRLEASLRMPHCHHSATPLPPDSCSIRPRSLVVAGRWVDDDSGAFQAPEDRSTAARELPAHAWPRSVPWSRRQSAQDPRIQEPPSVGDNSWLLTDWTVPLWRATHSHSITASRISLPFSFPITSFCPRGMPSPLCCPRTAASRNIRAGCLGALSAQPYLLIYPQTQNPSTPAS